MNRTLFRKYITLAFLVSFALPSFSQDRPWKLKTEKEGITIYNRSVSYSRVKELKMTTTVEGTLGSLINIINDVTRFPEWMYGCKSGETIFPEDGSPSYDRATLQFPKPFSYRVMFTRSTLSQDSITKIVTLKTAAISEKVQKDESLVLLENMTTSWVLTPLPSGEVAIESYLFCDPGGNLPFFLVNALLDRGPMRTIQKLKKRLAEPAFQKVKLNYIED